MLVHLTKIKKNVKVLILTKSISDQLRLDAEKFRTQFFQIEIREFNRSHDRFIIINDKAVFSFGASLKDLGKKWFAFSKMEKESLMIISELNK